MSHRASANLKDDIDRAIGAEFGWGSGGRTSVERSASVVGTGVVVSAKAQAGDDASWRTKSWASEAGLVAVPESAEEEYPGGDTSGRDGHRRMGSDDDDRELLLGRQEPPPDRGLEAQEGGASSSAAANESRKRRRES